MGDPRVGDQAIGDAAGVHLEAAGQDLAAEMGHAGGVEGQF